jgi:hypothetical protein
MYSVVKVMGNKMLMVTYIQQSALKAALQIVESFLFYRD